MKQSESIKEIASALSKAQGAMNAAQKESENPHFKKKYADLTSVWQSIREPLATNGLSVIQNIVTVADGVAVETQINHCSGEWFRFDPCVIPIDKRSAHGVGSAITYGKRYSLSAAVGVVCDDDDDGNGATANAPTSKPENREKPPYVQPSKKPDSPKQEELSELDQKVIGDIIQLFSETTCHNDFMAICNMIKQPDSVVTKCNKPDAVKEKIRLAIAGHKHRQPERQESAA